jgi:hypothetical protein
VDNKALSEVGTPPEYAIVKVETVTPSKEYVTVLILFVAPIYVMSI